MKIKPLSNCGVEILDCTVENLTDDDYQEIKNALLDKQVVVFKNQTRQTLPFAKLMYKLGNHSIANWEQCRWDVHGNFLEDKSKNFINPFTYNGSDDLYPVQRVTGQKIKGKWTGLFPTGKLDWHSNFNGPGRANCVALQGVSEGVRNTSTSFLDTTLAYADMSDEFKDRCASVIGKFEYAPQIWAEGMPPEHYAALAVNIAAYEMPLVNSSFTGKKGLYFHYHNKCSFPSDPTLLEDLKKLCLNEKYIYTHYWEPGDIIVMDQILTLHKRDQDDPKMLTERILHRYTFHIDERPVS